MNHKITYFYITSTFQQVSWKKCSESFAWVLAVSSLTTLHSGRLVLSRFEFEEVSSGENALEVGEDEEEVWLFWRDSNKEIRSKSIRELAQDAKEGQKEDRDVLSYYRLTACAVAG